MGKQALVLRAPSLERTGGHGALILDTLPYDVQDRLQRLSTLLQYRRGERIYGRGDDAQFVYFVSSGMIRIFRFLEDGHRQIVRFSIEGDMIGIPQNGRYVNSAETVCTSLVYRLPWKVFRQLMLTTPELQMFILEKVAAVSRDCEVRLVMLGQQIFHRVVSFLMEMTQLNSLFDPERQRLNLPMNRFDVADYLGTSAETAGRALTRLEKLGVIRRIGGRIIQISDLEKLRALQYGPRRCPNGEREDQHSGYSDDSEAGLAERGSAAELSSPSEKQASNLLPVS